MGKASRRSSVRRSERSASTAPVTATAPFVRRPFEGLPGETDWVAMREILPAATARVTLATGPQVTVATVLPLAWSALHRTGGEVFVSTQSGSASGDASRDLAGAIHEALALDEGTPLVSAPPATIDTPRLQDVLDPAEPFAATLHEGFDFWVGDTELDEAGLESLKLANESATPTVALASRASTYWCDFGDRAFIRFVLPHDEDAATDGLSRLLATRSAALADGSRLLGAFRACGLLIPVWEVDRTLPAESYEEAMAALADRLEDAIAVSTPLSPEERRARSGLVSRQVTLR